MTDTAERFARDATQYAWPRLWLAEFASAVNRGDYEKVASMFSPDGCWRDVLTFTWSLHTFAGREKVRAAFEGVLNRWSCGPFKVGDRLTVRESSDYGRPVIHVEFAFTTVIGSGRGLVRLVPASTMGEAPVAWTLLTALEELVGGEGHLGSRRPKRAVEEEVFGGPNWLDRRVADSEYHDRSPQVLVVGGGQAGLSLAARLRQLDVDTLIVDRFDRVGDNWRRRYHSLTLHNEIWSNHLPYLPFPPSWPIYIPKDKLANWFESYVDIMELNYWPGTEFAGGSYDPQKQRWTVDLRRSDGTLRTLSPAHVVMATGVSGIPKCPAIPGLEEFSGPLVHSSRYTQGSEYKGLRVLVVGTGNSGHDVALDLHLAGAQVTMMQRSPTTIVSLEPTAHRFYAGYSEDGDTDVSDLRAMSVPYPLMVELAKKLTQEGLIADREIIEALESVGFKTDIGEDGTGWQFKYLRYGGGYYINIGCSELVASGEIGLCHFEEVERFTGRGLRLRDGSELPFDACILATGYKGMQESVRVLFGDDVADKVGPVWGFDEEGELSNVWKRTPQDGLWFMMGSLTQCRIYSRFLAMQIWASEARLLEQPV